MKDLIERLRTWKAPSFIPVEGHPMLEAADFIEQQAAEIERVKELWEIDQIESSEQRTKIHLLQATLSAMEKQEPVAWMHIHGNHSEVSERCLTDHEKGRGWTETPLYTAPKVAPLTDEQIEQAVKTFGVSWTGYREDEHGFYTIPVLSPYHYQFARAIESAHGIGGQQP